jgi:aspartate aminotransferase
MPSLSKRASTLGNSPIRSLSPFARAAKDVGVKVHHLNIGQPDILTPPSALAKLRSYDESVIKYGDSEGSLELRTTVARYYTKHVSPIHYQNVMVTTGASEAIAMALSVCFNEGDEIIVPEPFYANYLGFAHVAGVKLVAVTSSIEAGFALPDPSGFETLINDRTKGILLCNPGNPTGSLYSKVELKTIAKLVARHDLFLIVDEVYREFCYDEEFTSLLNFSEIEEQVLVVDSISKVFSACGTRVGFIITRNKELLHGLLKYAELRLCPPAIGQFIANECYLERDTYIHEVKEEYKKRRDYLYKRLKSMTDVVCYKPGAAFYIMTELPIDDSRKFCRWLLEEFRYNNETLMLAPGAGFYFHEELGKRQVRIAFILGIEELRRAMDCLEEGLRAYAKVMKKELSIA